MNQHLIDAKKVLELIPILERYNSKYREWGKYSKEISFILKMIEKSEWSFHKACYFLKTEGAPPIEQQFRLFKKGLKTTHEPWNELDIWKKSDLSITDFFPSAIDTENTVKKILTVEGRICKTETLHESSIEFRNLVLEILDGNHPKLKIMLKSLE